MGCPARGKVGEGNVVVHSVKDQRLMCTECGRTFALSKGTPYYWLRHPTELFTIVVTLIAHGCPVQAIVAAYRLDERTVMSWQERAGLHCQKVHEHQVVAPRDLEHVQADEIRIKAQGKVLWLAMAIMVRTRLWLGGVIAQSRDEHLIVRLIGKVRSCALARPLLFCVDGLKDYLQAIRQTFRSPLPSRIGRPRLISWPDILIGQVIKKYQGKHVVDIFRRMAQGPLETAQTLLTQSHGGSKLNTAFIERLNATFRSRLAVLARRTRALLRNPQTLEPLMYLMGCVYNFCTYHKGLRLPGLVGGHRWIQRTPAIAAGIANHCWTVNELLSYHIPPPAWSPPIHRGQRSASEKALIARWGS
jgi:transposase-like protein